MRADGAGGSGEPEALLRAAKEAAQASYSPYSSIRVGAALEAADGRVFAGCNVENASFGLTLCAERTALVKAVSEGAQRFTRIAVWSSLPRALMPCGACLQVLHEFAPDMLVVVLDAGARPTSFRLDELLPHGMGPSDLGSRAADSR